MDNSFPVIAKVLFRATLVSGTGISIEEWPQHFELVAHGDDGEDYQWLSFDSTDTPTLIELLQKLESILVERELYDSQ